MRLADQYFVALVIMTQTFNHKDTENIRSVIKKSLDNSNVDRAIQNTNWNALLSLDHMRLYNKFLEKVHLIYATSSESVRIKQRKQDNIWITQEIMESCYLKNRGWHNCRKIVKILHLGKNFAHCEIWY